MNSGERIVLLQEGLRFEDKKQEELPHQAGFRRHRPFCDRSLLRDPQHGLGAGRGCRSSSLYPESGAEVLIGPEGETSGPPRRIIG
jgi:hypothetical protein